MTDQYTALQRAEGDAQKLGELMGWHCKHLAQEDTLTEVLVAAADTEIADLKEKLEAANLRRAELLETRDKRERWDAFNLLDAVLNGEQFQGLKTKSVKLPHGYVVGSRSQKALLKIVDPQPLMTAMPDCCELRLKEGDAKKHLVVSDGRVIFADTGEFLPDGTVEITREESEKYYLKRPDGTELELAMAWQAEDEPDTDNGGADEHTTTGDETNGNE